MGDWKVTISRTLMTSSGPKTLESDYVVEGTTRNLAIPIGIDEIFKREAGDGYALVPKECVDYWNQWRMTGGQLYEFQTEIEGKWGVNFGINEIRDVSEPEPAPAPHRNGKALPAPTTELPDLNSMLEHHLKLLTERQAVLSEELQRKQAEFDRNASDIMRIASMVSPPPAAGIPYVAVHNVPLPIPPKKRKPKDRHADG